jgi:hypothetical protein
MQATTENDLLEIVFKTWKPNLPNQANPGQSFYLWYLVNHEKRLHLLCTHFAVLFLKKECPHNSTQQDITVQNEKGLRPQHAP